MDSGYCCSLAGKKLLIAIHAPVKYIINDVFQFISLACSSNSAHAVPTFVFVVSIAILLKNQKENFLNFFDNIFELFLPIRIKVFLRSNWLTPVFRNSFLGSVVLLSFCSWKFFQELVYCMVWFMTSESINPDLRYKWWFRANETMKGSSSRVIGEVIPPGVVAWIIMMLASSICLVISVNNFNKRYNIQPIINIFQLIR